MAVKVKVTSRTKEVSEQFKKAVERGLTAAAIIVESDAKLRSPIDSGTLMGSIAKGKVVNSSIQIGTNIEYAPYVEYGTSRMAAQPYLTPALIENKAKIQKVFESQIKQGVK